MIVCSPGIYDLGCIGDCINLERLDLSGNKITNLAPLSSLRLLQILNVSANRISNLGTEYYKTQLHVKLSWDPFVHCFHCAIIIQM